MTPHLLLVLEIIKLSLELSIRVIDNLTPEQKQQWAARHAEWEAFWQGMLERVKD